MSTITVSAEGDVHAPPDRVYRILANYRDHHPHILPSAFTSFTVEEGGVGTGTMIRFSVRAGGRTQHFHQRIEEPEPGRVMQECEIGRDFVTTFTVDPSGTGSRVTMETTWTSGGARGFVERILAPRLLRPIYEEELTKLDRYAREHPEA